MAENADGAQEKSGGSSVMGRGIGCKMWAMTLPARDTPQRLRSSGSGSSSSDEGSKVALKNPTLEWPSVRQTTTSDPNDKPS